MQNTSTQNTVQRICDKMLDVAGAILDTIERRDAPPSAGPLTPDLDPAFAAASAAPWRWTNNQFAFWRLCAKPVCRRARCCRGAPRTCLDRHLPQVPLDLRNRVRAMLRARPHLRPIHQPSASNTTPAAPETNPCL